MNSTLSYFCTEFIYSNISSTSYTYTQNCRNTTFSKLVHIYSRRFAEGFLHAGGCLEEQSCSNRHEQEITIWRKVCLKKLFVLVFLQWFFYAYRIGLSNTSKVHSCRCISLHHANFGQFKAKQVLYIKSLGTL